MAKIMEKKRVTQGMKTQANLKAHELLGSINRIIMLQEMQQEVIGRQERHDLLEARSLVTGVINNLERSEGEK